MTEWFWGKLQSFHNASQNKISKRENSQELPSLLVSFDCMSVSQFCSNTFLTKVE